MLTVIDLHKSNKRWLKYTWRASVRLWSEGARGWRDRRRRQGRRRCGVTCAARVLGGGGRKPRHPPATRERQTPTAIPSISRHAAGHKIIHSRSDSVWWSWIYSSADGSKERRGRKYLVEDVDKAPGSVKGGMWDVARGRATYTMPALITLNGTIH